MLLPLPGESYEGPLPPLSEQQTELQKNVELHIEKIAGEIGERNLQHYEKLESAAEYIETSFKNIGYEVNMQVFEVKELEVKNIYVIKKGDLYPDKIVVIGAHYDTAIGATGADDNASGVATVLELARLFKALPMQNTIHFVCFVNEESPYYATPNMGSFRYARELKEKNQYLIGMISIEAIGYYSEEENSQRYPFPVNFFYPTIGNFVGFVGNFSSYQLTRQVIDTFRKHAKFPSQGLIAPGWFSGVGWSDHWSFWKFKYPAMMITTTTLFRNPNFHSSKDTPDTINHQKVARVIDGLFYVITNLANNK